MKEFYQTKEFYHAVAFVTLAVIVILFRLRKRIFPEKKLELGNWALSSDYISIKALIQCSESESELQHYANRVEQFYDLHFNIDQDNKELIRYYSRLLEAISVRKSQMRIPA